MENTFWLNNPKVLLRNKYMLELWPNNEYSLERKLNAITRLITILLVLGYYLTKSMKILISYIITLVVILILYNYKSNKKITNMNIMENFSNKGDINDRKLVQQIYENKTMPTEKNPFMNITIDEYANNVERQSAAPSYNKNISNEINNITKPKDKLFNNLGDNLNHETFLRNFNTMPNTKIPNDQRGFADFCYGDMKSCKDGDKLECLKNTSRKI